MQKGKKKPEQLCLVSTTARSHNQTEKGWERNIQRKRVSFFKEGKNQNLNICNQHCPNAKRNSLQLQQVSNLELDLIKNISSLQIPVASARYSIPQVPPSKSHIWKQTVPETAYFTFSGPQKEERLRPNSPYFLANTKRSSSSCSSKWQLRCWSINPDQSNSPSPSFYYT